MLGASPLDRWGSNEHLLAHLSDMSQLLIQITYAVAGGKKSLNLDRLPRPGEKKRVKRPSFLRVVDDETGEEIEPNRAEGDHANERARSLLPGIAKKKSSPEVPAPTFE